MSKESSLKAEWDAASAEWIEWARSPDRDHAFWRMNLPQLLRMLPAPGSLTIDVGCGEGRVARELKLRGHHVVGIESSPALAQSAREADPDFEVHVADAAAMPLRDDSADLAIAMLSLMNMDDMPSVLNEMARILRPGCHLCFSVLHPVNSWGDSGQADYFAAVRYSETITAAGADMTLHETHRPIRDYFVALKDAGFVVEDLCEPVPDFAHVAAHPEAKRWLTRPGFLHMRARLSRSDRPPGR